MRNKKLYLALLGAGLASGSAVSTAVFAADEVSSLDTMVVSATRSEINIKESPASISVITAQDMEKMTIFTVDEALSRSVGVMNRRTKGFMETSPSLTMRGLSNARDSLVIVDGIIQNDSRNGQVNWTMIDSENVERIELVRGPYSSLYGGNAMGGVVSIITKMPERTGASLKIGTGGSLDSTAPENFRDLSFKGNIKATDTLAFGLTYRKRGTDGYPTTHVNASNAVIAGLPEGTTGWVPYITNVGAESNLIGDMGDNWYEDDTVGLRASFAPSDRTRLDISYVDSESDYGYDFPNTLLRTSVDIPNIGIVDDIATFANVPVTTWLNGALFARGGTTDQTNSGLSFRTAWNDINMKVTVGHIEKETTTVIVGMTAANAGHAPIASSFEGGGGRLAPITASSKTTADVQFDMPLLSNHHIVFGVASSTGDLTEERWSLSNWTDPGSRIFMSSDASGKDQIQSIYFQDAWFITDTLTSYIGARQDWWKMKGGQVRSFTAAGDEGSINYDSVDESSFNPKLSLVFRPTQQTTYRGSVGKAFRAPNLFEFFGTAQLSGNEFVGNPGLKPETVTSWELGVDHSFASGINAIATYFMANIDDRIATQTVDGISRPQNVSEAEINGLELELNGPLAYGFSWTANYTYTDTEVTKDPNPDIVGNRLPHAPKTMYNLGLDWRYDNWLVSANYYHQSKRFTNVANSDTNTGVPGSTDSYSLTDVKGTYRFSDRHSASVGINNVFDKEYRQFYLSPGRFWFAELRSDF